MIILVGHADSVGLFAGREDLSEQELEEGLERFEGLLDKELMDIFPDALVGFSGLFSGYRVFSGKDLLEMVETGKQVRRIAENIFEEHFS